MAKRKQKNVEVERQLKKRRMIFRLISIFVAAGIVAAIGIGIWVVQDSRWIMRYDGGRVSTNDFRAIHDIFFGGDPAPQSREGAIEILQQIIALQDRAARHNVGFTAEERENAAMSANWNIRFDAQMQFGFDVVPYISDERLGELFFMDPLLARLMDIYVPTYILDEEEIAPLLEAYLEENLDRYLDLQVHILILEEFEEAEEAHGLIGTMDFEEIIRLFTPGIEEDFAEDEEIPTTDAVQFSNWIDDPDDKAHLLGLQPGEYSRIVEWYGDGMLLYMLFHAVSREEPDPEVAEASFRENLIDSGRDTVFDDLVVGWVEEANFRINTRGYNTTVQ